MKINEQWLREWVNPPITLQHLADQLTMAGLEVDDIAPVSGKFTHVVIGHVQSAIPHPNSDRLKCCKVDVGQDQILDIVCGGVNVRDGLKVAVALVGAELPGDIQIKSTEIRGQKSEGMICSAKELGLNEEAETKKGIMELAQDATIGMDFHDYLSLPDHVITIELTANRGDCLSVVGIAREVALMNHMSIRGPAMEPIPAKIEDIFPVNVTAESQAPHYVGRVIRNINSQATTPVWMTERLVRCGQRSIHPVVDVCNYVMLELGQPMHGFDLNKLDQEIQVRFAKTGEKIVLIDGSEVTLDNHTLVIADQSKPQAIAGIMGAASSAVSESTQDIFLESAYFDPITVRFGVRHQGIHSDSSYRFERGVDYQLQKTAIERATALLLEIVGGEPGPVIEKLHAKSLPILSPIKLRRGRIQRLLGIVLNDPLIEEILKGLGMTIQRIPEGWLVSAPTYRFDVMIEEDLIEELARVYGYHHIPEQSLYSQVALPDLVSTRLPTPQIAKLLADRDYSEVIAYSFVDENLQKLFDAENRAGIALSNPITRDMSVMRSSLWPGLIQALRYNLNRQNYRVRLFETGLSFQVSAAEEWLQIPKLALLASGDASSEQWAQTQRPLDFYDIKADVMALLSFTINPQDFQWRTSTHPALHPGQSADIYLMDQKIGHVGVLHPKIAQELDISQTTMLAELNITVLEARRWPKFQPLSKFPSMRRDLALVIDQQLAVEAVRQQIIQTAGDLLKEIVIFDVYQGKGIEDGKKSIALGLTFQDSSRTLIDEEINSIVHSVVSVLQQAFNAKLRT